MRTIDKGKGAWRKGIAAVAAIPMVFTLMTAGTAGAAEVDSSIQPATSDTNKVLDLGFDGNLTDNSAAETPSPNIRAPPPMLTAWMARPLR